MKTEAEVNAIVQDVAMELTTVFNRLKKNGFSCLLIVEQDGVNNGKWPNLDCLSIHNLDNYDNNRAITSIIMKQ